MVAEEEEEEKQGRKEHWSSEGDSKAYWTLSTAMGHFHQTIYGATDVC